MGFYNEFNKKEEPLFTGITRGVGGFGFGDSGTTTTSSSSDNWKILAYTDRPSNSTQYTEKGWAEPSGYVPFNASTDAWAYNGISNTDIPGTWDTTRPWHRFGQMGRHMFQSATVSNTGASSRTSAGDGDGFYNAAFTETNITKIALVGDEGTVDLANPENSTNHLVYDLVGTSGNTTDADAGTGSYTLIDLIQTLSNYNRNNTSWAGQGTSPAYLNNQLFNGPNSRNFTCGGSDSGNKAESGYSGCLQSAAGKMHPLGATGDEVLTGVYPNLFCFWGINLDSDHDTQVCCAYYGGTGSTTENPYGGYMSLGRNNEMGSLSTQTSFMRQDLWRHGDPVYSFWSLWGNDWHTTSLQQNISGTGTGDQDDQAQTTNVNTGSSGKFGGSTEYQLSAQTFPGVHYPHGSATTVADPNTYMVKKVYMLGFTS